MPKVEAYTLRSTNVRQKHKHAQNDKKSKLKKAFSYGLLALISTSFFATNSMAATGPASETAHAAYSINFLDPCGNPDEQDIPSLEAWPGNSSSLLGTDRTFVSEQAGPVGSRAVLDSNQLTAYEWYGNAGMSRYYGGWDSLEGTDACKLVDQPSNILGTSLLDFSSYIGEVGLTILSWGLSTSQVTNLLIGEDDGIISGVIEGFQDSLYQNYLLPVVMLAALWIGWQGLVKKRGTEAIQGTFWIIISAVAAVAFFIWPTEIARTTDNAIGAVGSTIVSAMATSVAGQDETCSLPESAPEREIRTVQCSLWSTFIYQPWASSQFGATAKDTFEPDVPITFRPDSTDQVSIPLYFLDTRTLNYAEVKSGDERSDSERESQWIAFTDEYKQEQYKKGWSNFVGKEGSGFSDGLVALAALLFGTMPLVFFSFTLILQQVTFILLMLVGPLFLLAGLVPGLGRRLMLGWLELSASTVIKRLVTYVVAGLLLTAIGIIIAASGGGAAGNFGQIVMIGIAGVATVAFRRKILDQYGTVNLGGDQTFLTKQDGKEITERGKGMVTEPIAGAAEARAQGKGVAGTAFGALRGGVRNIRNADSGGETTAATTVRDARAKNSQAKGVPTKKQNYRFTSGMEEKEQRLKALNRVKKQQNNENSWMKSGQMTTAEWKEYSASNGNRAIPRPKNNAFATELIEAGVPLRSPVDTKLDREIETLENEIEQLSLAGAKNARKTLKYQDKMRRVDTPGTDTTAENEESAEEYSPTVNDNSASVPTDFVPSGSSSSDTGETATPKPTSPQRPRSENTEASKKQANPHARRQAIKKNLEKKTSKSDGDLDTPDFLK